MLGVSLYKRARSWCLRVAITVAFLVATVQLALLARGLVTRMTSHVTRDLSCDSCSHFNFSYIIENGAFCRNARRVFLLIVVTSSPRNARLRTAIRRTWANVTQHRGLSVRTLFVFGKHDDERVNSALVAENEQYGDMMQADFRDSYSNLTVKSIVALRWATTHCRHAQYVLKTDDDAFNNPARYVDLLRQQVLPLNAIGGYCFMARPRGSSRVDVYLPVHCWGPAYVMSTSAALAVVRVARHIPAVDKEDVFVSGLCRLAAGLDYRQIGGVQARQASLTPCDLATWVVNVYEVAPPEMAMLWGWATDAHLPRTCRRQTDHQYFVYVGAAAVILWAVILAHVLRTEGCVTQYARFFTPRKKHLRSDIITDDV